MIFVVARFSDIICCRVGGFDEQVGIYQEINWVCRKKEISKTFLSLN